MVVFRFPLSAKLTLAFPVVSAKRRVTLLSQTSLSAFFHQCFVFPVKKLSGFDSLLVSQTGQVCLLAGFRGVCGSSLFVRLEGHSHKINNISEGRITDVSALAFKLCFTIKHMQKWHKKYMRSCIRQEFSAYKKHIWSRKMSVIKAKILRCVVSAELINHLNVTFARFETRFEVVVFL